jgi:hypothetical protein
MSLGLYRHDRKELEQRGLIPQDPTALPTTSVRVETRKHCRQCLVFTAACQRCMKLYAAASTNNTKNRQNHTPFLYQNKLNDAGCVIDAGTCSRNMHQLREGHQREMRCLMKDKKRHTRQAEVEHKQRGRFPKPTTSILNMKKSLLALQKQQRFEEARALHAEIAQIEKNTATSQKAEEDQTHSRTLQRQHVKHAGELRKVHEKAFNQQARMQLRSSSMVQGRTAVEEIAYRAALSSTR